MPRERPKKRQKDKKKKKKKKQKKNQLETFWEKSYFLFQPLKKKNVENKVKGCDPSAHAEQLGDPPPSCGVAGSSPSSDMLLVSCKSFWMQF